MGDTAAHFAAKKKHVELFIALVLHRDYRIEIENHRYETANSIYHASCMPVFRIRYRSLYDNTDLNMTHVSEVLYLDTADFDVDNLDSLRTRHRIGGHFARPKQILLTRKLHRTQRTV